MRITRPRLLSSLGIFAALLIAVPTAIFGQSTITHEIALPIGSSWCDDSMILDLFSQINAFRAQQGVPALRTTPLGMKDADMRAVQFSQYMATHTPGSPGFNPHEGYDTTAASLGYQIISENLAYMTTSPAYIVYAVWQDALHIAAMLDKTANVAGVSCLYSNGVAYWTFEPGYDSGVPTQGNNPTMDAEESAFVTLVNSYRQQNGVGPLQVSIALETAAQWMSHDMARNNNASHTDSLGRNPYTRLTAFGYPYTPWGENIAGGFSDAQTVLNQWITFCDPGPTGACTYAHRQILLSPNFYVLGIGRAYEPNSAYGWYWTADFGGWVDQTMNPPPTGGAPSVVSFSASPLSIAAGQTATLSWNTSGATSLSIDNGVGDVSNATSRVVAPLQTTTYTLTATNSAGSVTARITVTVVTAPTDVQPPSAPVLVSATARGANQVDLVWTASVDNVGVLGYRISRNGVVLTSVSGATLTYADTSASANTTYTYFIKAYDAAGNSSAASNSAQATTAATGPTTCLPATNAFTGCYYNNTALSGNPVLIRTDSQINFDWANDSPDKSLSPMNFSIRWQGNFSFQGGSYTFSVMTSDGMRIYIDGELIMDRWRIQAPTMYTLRPTLTAGTHLIVVEYYEQSANATAHLTWLKN